jgi:hypothetical protein
MLSVRADVGGTATYTVLFVVNATLAVAVVAPAERAAGATYRAGPDAFVAKEAQWLGALHVLQLALSVALIAQQVRSWQTGPAAPAPAASAAAKKEL